MVGSKLGGSVIDTDDVKRPNRNGTFMSFGITENRKNLVC